MRYHWRHELRAPEDRPRGSGQGGGGDLDPRRIGTILHRCMERLDWTAPPAPGDLVGRVLREMGLEPIADDARETLIEQWAAILQTCRDSDLFGRLAGAAEVYRERDFLLRLGPAVVRGQIDLLWRDSDGWGFVDYKSDRLGRRVSLSDRASHYELQMQCYALSVAKQTGQSPSWAGLYFLRTGQVSLLETDAETQDKSASRIERLATELIASGRTGAYRRCQKDDCEFCGRENQ